MIYLPNPSLTGLEDLSDLTEEEKIMWRERIESRIGRGMCEEESEWVINQLQAGNKQAVNEWITEQSLANQHLSSLVHELREQSQRLRTIDNRYA